MFISHVYLYHVLKCPSYLEKDTKLKHELGTFTMRVHSPFRISELQRKHFWDFICNWRINHQNSPNNLETSKAEISPLIIDFQRYWFKVWDRCKRKIKMVMIFEMFLCQTIYHIKNNVSQ